MNTLIFRITNSSRFHVILSGDEIWAWLDPGVMAVIGAGSLLGGVTRLNLAVTVIIVSQLNQVSHRIHAEFIKFIQFEVERFLRGSG